MRGYVSPRVWGATDLPPGIGEEDTTVAKLEEFGFEGPDASLKESIEEYGLCWKLMETKPPAEPRYLFLYAVGMVDNVYRYFSWATMSKAEFIQMVQEKQLHTDLANFCGCTVQELTDRFPSSVDDLLVYRGYENVFGSPGMEFVIRSTNSDQEES